MQVDKFNYLGVAFTGDERQDEELDTRIGKANAITRALHYSDVIPETRIVEKQKVINFQNSFCSHSHRWSGILSNDQKRAIASASVLQPQVQEFYLPNKLYFRKQIRKDQWDNLELHGPITLRILGEIARE